MVRVSDNGRGISAEVLPRIFDLFVQGNPPWPAPTGDSASDSRC
jgi:K+-sensing histidine kinase KdpD